VVCSANTHWSESRRTHNYILLSHLRLTQLGGPGPRIHIPQEQGDPVIRIYCFRFLVLKQEFVELSVSLQTTRAVETHRAEKQCLGEQVNMLRLWLFRVGTRLTNLSRREKRYLPPVDII
jgi:hypothetical protein